MGVAVKRLRIGRRRAQSATKSPLELARAPALENERWQVPDRFNFTRDVVEVLARDPKRRALTFVGSDSIVEPWTFHELAEGSNRWASILRGQEVQAGDRVLVLADTSVDWLELVLGCLKIGAVPVPCSPTLTASALEVRISATGASLVVAGDEPRGEIAQMSFTPQVLHTFEGRGRRKSDPVDPEPSEDTAARDVALVFWTPGTAGAPKPVAHTHGATFAVRCQAEHWLDAGSGDIVWCTAPSSSPLTLATVFGSWARGAEVALHAGKFDPLERLELLHRFDVTILCQPVAEYRALARRSELARFRSERLRRLLSTGDSLDPELVELFQSAWGRTIHNGYGQSETNVVVATGQNEDEAEPSEALGTPLPGHYVAVVDEQGNELPPGIEGSLAIRGRPPTLFAGYWDSPNETREAFRGDWYLTGDVAVADAEGELELLGRAEDMITSRGRTFGPRGVERVLAGHNAVAATAVIGMRDLELGGHYVRAFVVLADGVEESQQLAVELRHFVAEALPEQQVPREIEFIDELPTAPGGGVRRGELRDRPIVGRPLWELEDEPSSAEPAEAAPTAAPAAYVAEQRMTTPVDVGGFQPVTPVEPTPEPPPVLADIPAANVPAVDASPPVEVVEHIRAETAHEPPQGELSTVIPERPTAPESVEDRSSEQDSAQALPVPEPVLPEPVEETLEEAAPTSRDLAPSALVEPSGAGDPDASTTAEPETAASATAEPALEPSPEPVATTAEPAYEPWPEPASDEPGPLETVAVPEPVLDTREAAADVEPGAPEAIAGFAVEPEPAPEVVIEATEPVSEMSFASAPEPSSEITVEPPLEPVPETSAAAEREAAQSHLPDPTPDPGPPAPEPSLQATAAAGSEAAELSPSAPLLSPDPPSVEPAPEPVGSTAEVVEDLDDEVATPDPEQVRHEETAALWSPISDALLDIAGSRPGDVGAVEETRAVAAPEPAPAVDPEPEPEPTAGSMTELEPLPDYIVPPGSTAEPVPTPPPVVSEPEPEAVTGPLPEYIIDPDQPVVSLVPEPTTDEPPASELSASAFPAVAAISLDASASDAPRELGDGERERRKSSAAARRPRSRGSEADPGDEPAETSWMRGLSNRLSAYSLGSQAKTDDASPDEPDPDG